MLWNEVTEVQGYRWVDVLSAFVIGYNKAPHEAHNKSPYEAFFGFKMRGAYSTPDETTRENRQADETITEATQEEQVEVDNSETIIQATQEDETEEDGTGTMQENTDNGQERNSDQIAYEVHVRQVEKIRKEIVQNDEQYRKKLVIRGSVHRRKLVFEPGERVAIAGDHDTNQKTRKRKLEQICSMSGEVVGMCSNNRTVRVKINGEVKTFAAKNLRKLRQD